MNMQERVASYIRLRDHKKLADEEFKKSMERVNAAMKKLEAEMLDELNQSGGKSFRSDAGTVYINVKTTATVEDRDVFLQEVIDKEIWDALDVRANKTVVREFADKGVALPGVKITQVATVGVRRGNS